MDCHIITDFAELTRLESEWQTLWRASSRREVFSSFPYVQAWWSIYQRRYRVFTPVVTDSTLVLAILPLVLDGDVLRFFCHTDADFNDVLVDTSRAAPALAGIFQTLAAHKREWLSGVLDNLPESSPLLSLSGGHGLQTAARIINVCPTLDLRTEPAQEFERVLGKKPQVQEEKRLQRFGELRFRHLETHAEILDHLPAFFRQHTQRWALEGVHGRFTRTDSRDFYTAMVKALDPTHELRFSVLEAGTTPLAYHLGFEASGRFLFFKPTFDIDYWDFSPGKVLLRKLLQYAQQKGLAEFDFSIGDEDYKHKYANLVRRNYQLQLGNSRLLSQARFGLSQAAVSAKKAVRDRLGARSLDPSAFLGRLKTVLPSASTAPAVSLPASEGASSAAKSPLRVIGLSQMADLSLRRPDLLPASELADVRRRQKLGEVFCILENDGEWCGGWRTSPSAHETAAGDAPSSQGSSPRPPASPGSQQLYRDLRSTSPTAMQRFIHAARAAAHLDGHREVAFATVPRQKSTLAALLSADATTSA